jgi:hypothetical protein
MENIDEPSHNKWYLMVCELHNPSIHGKTDDSYEFIENHYLVYDVFDAKTNISYFSTCFDEFPTSDDDFSDEDDEIDKPVYMKHIVGLLKDKYSTIQQHTHLRNSYKHPTIRNYTHIIAKPDYIKPEIGQYIMLPTQESVAILKTIWIRLIQRKWRKICDQRKHILRCRLSTNSLKIRETTGKWPPEYRNVPCLTGMLSDLNNKTNQ